MIRKQNNFTFTSRLGLAEAAEENPEFVLSLDYRNPGRVVAFISTELHRTISRLLIKMPGLDGVLISASISSLVRDACEYLEDDALVDQLIGSLESAIQLLHDFQVDRAAALRALTCDRCSPSASDHYRPSLGTVRCQRPDCKCPEFAPLHRV